MSQYLRRRSQQLVLPGDAQECSEDPPDILEGIEPICDIEAAFDIGIDDDEVLELYDLNLDEAERKILEMKGKQSSPSDSLR